MTTTNTTSYVGPIAGNGTTPIPFTFQAVSDTEVGVIKDGVEIFVGFTVSVNPDGTGSVTPGSSWTGSQIYVFSKPDFQNQTEFPRFESWYPDQMDEPLDKLTRMAIALRNSISNVIVNATTLAVGEPATVEFQRLPWGMSFEFGIPQGPQGDDGDPGVNATVISNTVNVSTLLPGASATASAAHIGGGVYQLTLGIPRGQDGSGNVSDTVYGAGWNGQTASAPSQNAVYDKIETVVSSITALVSDTVYGAGWNGVAGVAPSQNAVYDKIEAVSTTIAGLISDTAYAGSWDGVTTIAPSKNAVYDQMELRAPKASPTFTGTPLAPTAAAGTDTTQIATTEFVQNELEPDIQSAGANSITPTFADDLVQRLAVTAAVTLNNPTGTAVEGHGIVVRIKANGAYSISYGTQYRAIGVTLPTATVSGKTLYYGMIFNTTDTKWDVVSVTQEA